MLLDWILNGRGAWPAVPIRISTQYSMTGVIKGIAATDSGMHRLAYVERTCKKNPCYPLKITGNCVLVAGLFCIIILHV